MQFEQYVRKPFKVVASQITEENFDEAFDLIGKEILTDEAGTRTIIIDRKIVPTINAAGVGWWVTRMGDNVRCYPNKIFVDQFEIDQTMVAKAAKIVDIDENTGYGDGIPESDSE